MSSFNNRSLERKRKERHCDNGDLLPYIILCSYLAIVINGNLGNEVVCVIFSSDILEIAIHRK